MRQIKRVVLVVLVAALMSITAGCGGVPNYLVVPTQASPVIHKSGNEIRIPASNHVSRYLDDINGRRKKVRDVKFKSGFTSP